jgi:hypothetical protein
VSGREGFGSLGVQLGDGARFDCHTYGDSGAGPILTLSLPGLSLAVSSRANGPVTSADVKRAHRLRDVVAVFVAETERLAQMTENAASGGERAA